MLTTGNGLRPLRRAPVIVDQGERARNMLAAVNPGWRPLPLTQKDVEELWKDYDPSKAKQKADDFVNQRLAKPYTAAFDPWSGRILTPDEVKKREELREREQRVMRQGHGAYRYPIEGKKQ